MRSWRRKTRMQPLETLPEASTGTGITISMSRFLGADSGLFQVKKELWPRNGAARSSALCCSGNVRWLPSERTALEEMTTRLRSGQRRCSRHSRPFGQEPAARKLESVGALKAGIPACANHPQRQHEQLHVQRAGWGEASTLYLARASSRIERATVIAVMCTIVSTFAPCCSTLTGFFMPSTIGPITSPSPITPSNL